MTQHELKMAWARAIFAATFDALKRIVPDLNSTTNDRKIAMRRLLSELEGAVFAYLIEQNEETKK